jgi:DNA-binding MarR family transcriptional regulator
MSNDQKNAPIVDPLSGLLGYELRRTSAAVMSSLSEALAPLELRPSEASLLSIIAENPGCIQSEIGRALRAQPANLVPLVTKLAAAGYIERDRREGRAIALHLTARGAELARMVQETFAKHETRIARRLPESVTRQLIETLRIICKDACCND